MPRIEKVRITGVKYDKMRKHYEDTIFDFLNEEEPQHTLLTLMNGGGKGMLLQMIFQTMMPLTTWGKHGENHIDALFYNEKLQFDPYTFHVAIEWRLDTDPVEWLVSGICITSDRKFGHETEETDTEPQYFLYTRKYQKPTDWSIDTLPIYDDETRQAISFDELESWLKKRKQDFQFYPKSKQPAYHKYLSSYGIERNEWRHMKDINRDEGGIEHYFKKGLDNFGLFHNLIIPEISHYLEEDQEENLLKIFRDNSIIAQKLPKLLKREDAYQLIKVKFSPIQEELKKGQSIESTRKDHHEQGNYLYFGMEEKRQSLALEEEKWKEERGKTVELQKEALWEKDNLEYAKEVRNSIEVSEQLKEIEDKVVNLNEVLKKNITEKQELEIDTQFLDYITVTKELENIEKQISLLENEQNLLDEKTQIQQMKEQLVIKWEKIEKELLQEIERYYALEHSYRKRLNALEKQLDQEEKEVTTIKAKIGTYTDFIKSHNEKSRIMEQQYGDIINRNPDLVVSRQMKALEELENKIQETKQEQEELHQEQLENRAMEAKLTNEQKSLSIDIEEAQFAKEKRMEEERVFHQMWCRFFQKDIPFAVYSEDGLETVETQMIAEIIHLNSLNEQLKKEIWNHQLDTMLVNDHYWIPNNDVITVVQHLDELGVPAMYGTELINELSEEDKVSYIERFPLLAYGVVIHEREWEEHVHHHDFQNMLSHSPVPIFIRERMNQEVHYAFELPREQGIEMAFDKEKWHRWKTELEKRTENLKIELQQAESKLDTANDLLEKIKKLRLTTYHELAEVEEGWRIQLADLVVKQRLLEEETASLVEKQIELSNNLKQVDLKRDDIKENLPVLKAWVMDHQKFLEYKDLKAEASQKLSLMEKRVQVGKQNHKDLNEEFDRWRNSFDQWKYRREQEVDELKEVIPAIQFPKDKKMLSEEAEFPQLENNLFHEVKPILKRLERMQEKIHHANTELAELHINRKHERSKQQKLIVQLDKLTPIWRGREYPNLPKQLIEEKLDKSLTTIKNLELELRTEEKETAGLRGRLEQLEKNKQYHETRILESHHRPVEAWLDLDLEEKQKSLKEKLKTIEEDLRDQKRVLEELSIFQQVLMTQQNTLKYHLSILKYVGEVPVKVKKQVHDNPEQAVDQWINKNKKLNEWKEEFRGQFNEKLRELRLAIQNGQMDSPLRKNINQLIPQLESDSIDSSIQIVASVIEHIEKELIKLKNDKQKSEQAQEVWVDRAVFRVITIMQSLKRMVNKMKIKNKEGHLFPLVEVERLNEIIATDEEDFRRLLREHFTKTIEILLETEDSIENLTDAQLKKHMDDSQLVLVSLRNRYPTLRLYKPQTTNAFLYEKPRKHHYTTWETLNKGSKVEAKGSGGQLLAARTIIMMMIMTFRRQENSSNWSVLITDNPFGQAVSAHILDPIFSIADTLKFQWIVLAPPELIKLDVSRRFPVYWKLELQQQKQGEVMKEVLQHGGRTFEDVELSLF